MARSDFEQRECWPVRLSTALLPISQRVDADLKRARKICLAQSHETPQRGDVFTGSEVAAH